MSGDLLNPGQLPDPRWQLVASSDFNLDGHADHIFQHPADGRLAIWLMNGDSQVRGFALTPDRAPDVNWKCAEPPTSMATPGRICCCKTR